MAPHQALQRIQSLDPERDHVEIAFLVSSREFPFDMTRALEFALYRTYAIPSIGALLDRTGEFTNRAQKRYDDTDLIISEIVEHGYDSERGRAALRQMNRIHARFNISNEDFLYVLSTLLFEPIRWNARYGWRPMVEKEKLGLYYFWREVGRRMDIKDIPPTFEAFEAFNVDYERRNFTYTPASRRVANATRDLFLNWFLPPRLHFLGRPVIYALMDDALLTAFRFPHPPGPVRALVEGGMRLRARILRLMPERRRQRIRTEMRHRSYPNGYRIEELGAPPPAFLTTEPNAAPTGGQPAA